VASIARCTNTGEHPPKNDCTDHERTSSPQSLEDHGDPWNVADDTSTSQIKNLVLMRKIEVWMTAHVMQILPYVRACSSPRGEFTGDGNMW
jgi:hypothetical protein